MTYFLVMALAVTTPAAADVSGSWGGTFTFDGRDAGPALLIPEQEGTALTGTTGPDENERHPITKGKVENDITC